MVQTEIQPPSFDLERTEEVRDLVEKMPDNSPRFLLYVILCIAGFLLFFGIVIKYPEVVSGPVTISMGKAPVSLIAQSSGKLKLTGVSSGQFVREGGIVAVIDNSTDLAGFLLVDSLLHTFHPALRDSAWLFFPENLNLGDLNVAYYSFVEAFRKRHTHYAFNVYDANAASCRQQLKANEAALRAAREQLDLRKKQVEFSRREIDRDSFRVSLGDCSESGLDRTRNLYFSTLEGFRNAESSLLQLEMRSDELNLRLEQIRTEKEIVEQQLDFSCLSSFNTLQAAANEWKNRYAFVAPFAGRVEFLGFWKEDDYVRTGSGLFSILPDHSPLIGHLYLPSVGAGKVRAGQEVTIKLDDYPYLEYGTVNGVVETISLITHKYAQTQQPEVETYLVTVSLPSGLRTKVGGELGFRYEIKGVADIKTEKRRLIQRLFDKLKYAVQ